MNNDLNRVAQILNANPTLNNPELVKLFAEEILACIKRCERLQALSVDEPDRELVEFYFARIEYYSAFIVDAGQFIARITGK